MLSPAVSAAKGEIREKDVNNLGMILASFTSHKEPLELKDRHLIQLFVSDTLCGTILW